ncbi:MAG: hypothetical protein Ct9H90mP23_0720 [Methanobacteriota archaeon]|nr:MAG: hypothetical protein Ct9H90mP23_0720 [Euryarchaeota archaeon]
MRVNVQRMPDIGRTYVRQGPQYNHHRFGPAGYTAGLYSARAMLEPLMFADMHQEVS